MGEYEEDLLMGAGGGATSGAVTGAVIGSVVPGVGTAIGAGVGAVVGGVAGLFGGKAKNDQRKAQKEAEKRARRLSLELRMREMNAMIAAEKMSVVGANAARESAKDYNSPSTSMPGNTVQTSQMSVIGGTSSNTNSSGSSTSGTF